MASCSLWSNLSGFSTLPWNGFGRAKPLFDGYSTNPKTLESVEKAGFLEPILLAVTTPCCASVHFREEHRR
jgi:hypothetical protein